MATLAPVDASALTVRADDRYEDALEGSVCLHRALSSLSLVRSLACPLTTERTGHDDARLSARRYALGRIPFVLVNTE